MSAAGFIRGHVASWVERGEGGGRSLTLTASLHGGITAVVSSSGKRSILLPAAAIFHLPLSDGLPALALGKNMSKQMAGES
ncbi:hypothetical protein Y1Q_0014795 [Alligator mississippiensis]|uniref:Uncharacterized protein n=1 Tax=Alligator mississippiensis TaxID=8496 RepID=A0A151M237_ALLMI|nr:hypothetical protein Y1Q_0014795 [Alligator mississippiensis]